jgi:hypothetical protein
MPELDLAENGLDVVGHRSLALAGVGDRDCGWRDRVSEFGLGYRFLNKFKIEADRLRRWRYSGHRGAAGQLIPVCFKSVSRDRSRSP